MTALLPEKKIAPAPRVITTEPRFTDKVFRAVVTGGGMISLVILGLIGFFLIYNGFEAIRNAGLAFLTGFEWVDAVPEENLPASYGIGAMLYGTIVTGIIAMFFGVPIAVGTALFLSYYAPEWLKKPMVIVVDVMAAIPSIVYGLWGFFVLMPMAEYWAKLIHKYLGFIPIFDMPAPIVKIIFGEMGEELLLSSQKIAPLKLVESGFEFSFVDIEKAIKKSI
jgi:phosphate transport system permease protein